jgi:DNA polymerase-3 subunit delta
MFYVFHGDDTHAQSETLNALQARLGGDRSILELNTSRFEGHNLSFSELRHACDTSPFLGDKRLVIVVDAMARQPEYMAELLEYLPNLPDTTRLVFMESKALTASHPLVKLAASDENGFLKSFARPEGRELEGWISRRVNQAGGAIAPRANHLLALNVGNELDLLDNEIEKLVLYKDGETIEAEDVGLLCPYVAEASIFELVDALGSRHGKTAARLLHEKLGQGTEPFYLFSMFVRQFRLMIQVKELSNAGSRPPEIAKSLKIHGFVAGKLHQQSQNFTMAQLVQIYAHLLEVDVGVKTGQTDMATALSLLVAGVAM